MSYRMFDLFSLPLFAVTFSSIINSKWGTRLAYVHLIVCFVLILAYLYFRYEFSQNKEDPVLDTLDKNCSIFDHMGIHYLKYTPVVKASRFVIMFPGVKVGVRRMLREDIMKPYLKDSEILGFQCRGLGESDLSVHVSTETMLMDSMNTYALVTEQNTKELPIHLVGYSLGGFNALNLCNTVRDCCESVTLVGTMFDTENMSSLFKVSCALLGISNKNICKVEHPVIIIHSVDDEDIKIDEAEGMRDLRKANDLPTRLLMCGGSHASYSISDYELKRYKSIILGIELMK